MADVMIEGIRANYKRNLPLCMNGTFVNWRVINGFIFKPLSRFFFKSIPQVGYAVKPVCDDNGKILLLTDIWAD